MKDHQVGRDAERDVETDQPHGDRGVLVDVVLNEHFGRTRGVCSAARARGLPCLVLCHVAGGEGSILLPVEVAVGDDLQTVRMRRQVGDEASEVVESVVSHAEALRKFDWKSLCWFDPAAAAGPSAWGWQGVNPEFPDLARIRARRVPVRRRAPGWILPRRTRRGGVRMGQADYRPCGLRATRRRLSLRGLPRTVPFRKSPSASFGPESGDESHAVQAAAEIAVSGASRKPTIKQVDGALQ
jgi:hypothetical protein